MPSDLFAAPLGSLRLSDIQRLVDQQIEEGPRLEFKRALATGDGRPDRWMRDQSSIGNVARDDIAKEVVAFANAYGGLIIIGVEETDDNPKRAREIIEPHIPKVSDCAERLEQALRGVIDPPLAMLEVRGIESLDGNGLIILRVGSSPSAPHGLGRPPNAYVRRGSNSEPLTMRDMQSMFYERRTRLERVSQIVREQSARAEGIANDWALGKLMQPESNQIIDNTNGLAFQLSLISSEDMAIDNLPDLIKDEWQKSPIAFDGHVQFPPFSNEWKRGYRCVSYSAGYLRKLSRVELRADGVITISLVKADNKFHPSWYSTDIVQGFILAEWLRRWRGRPDIEFVLHGKFQTVGNPALLSKYDGFDSWINFPWESASVGPYSITSRADFPNAHDVIERELWNLFGSERRQELKINWNDLFQKAGL